MIREFCDWLSATTLSIQFQTMEWFVPLVQTVHIISIAILLPALCSIGYRLLTGPNRESVGDTVARSVPWIWPSLIVLLLTGALLTITEPARELMSWVFRTKMLLLALLVALLVWLRFVAQLDPDYWSKGGNRQVISRFLGVLVFVLGIAIATAGRWIAYV